MVFHSFLFFQGATRFKALHALHTAGCTVFDRGGRTSRERLARARGRALTSFRAARTTITSRTACASCDPERR